jgi:signal transduction histidine kinase
MTQVERIAFIVRQLLNLARPYKLQLTPVDLESLLSSTLEPLESNLKSAQVVAEIQSHENVRISGDKELLRQVFTNLFVNAVHAMPHGGRLQISYDQGSTEKDGDRFVCITVADTGTGIKPEHFSQLFDPFFTTKDVGRGIGLGLPVSRRIVDEHGGWIDAANNEHGGATFTVYLQLARGSSPASAPAPEKEIIAQ